MRRLVSSATALAADRVAETKFGYPPELLMEEAGIRLQDTLERTILGSLPGPVVYLAGPGNNGGDAWVMARHAHLRGRSCTVVALSSSSSSCRLQADRAAAVGVPVVPWPSESAHAVLEAAAMWVDGLWGTGLSAPLRPERAEFLRELEALRRRIGRPVVAVDVASGLWEGYQGGEPVLTATWTVTPGPLKAFSLAPGLREASGTLIEVPLAFPEPAQAVAQLLEETDLAVLVPSVGPHVHKGRRGHVALVGGAPGMTGALVLAARSAAAAGAGLVSLGVDAEVGSLVAPQVPAFQTRTVSALVAASSRYDAWVVGPGWGRGVDRRGLLKTLWETSLPLVLDADGLAVWTDGGQPARSAPTVLTPHPGEFRRLGVGEPSLQAAVALANNTGFTVVLKGSATWIAGEGRLAVWDGAEPALATGGSGDCLSGVVGAFLATGQGAFEAACAAVALHGTSGRRLARDRGWFTAELLPETLARIAWDCRTGPGPL